jgi:hypothetical protein
MNVFKTALRAAFVPMFVMIAATAAYGDRMALVLDEGAAKFYRGKALTIIDGTQTGDYRKDRYVVLERLSVNKGTEMELAPGSTVYLAEDAQIIVDGELTAVGVSFEPLPADHYYSIDGGTQAAQKLRRPWRGILVGQDGFVDLAGARIHGSAYGIHSFFPAAALNITLDSTCFADNAYYNVYTADRRAKPANACVNGAIQYDELPVVSISAQNKAETSTSKRDYKRLIPYGAATLIFTGLFTYDMVQHYSFYYKYNETFDPILAAGYRKGAESAATQAAIHGTLGLISAGVTGWVGYTIFF